MKHNTKKWFYGLATAMISAFASAASGAIGLPSVFTFDRVGLINMLKLSAVPALLALFAYLKQYPAPQLEATVDQQGNVSVAGNPVVEVTLSGEKKQ